MTTTPDENEDAELREMFANGIMVPLDLAVRAIEAMERLRLPLEHWHPWLQLADGELKPSERHEGAVGGLADLRNTYAWLSLFVHSVQLKHDEDPEVPGSRMLFYIVAGAPVELAPVTRLPLPHVE